MKYQCKSCSKWFQICRTAQKSSKALLQQHLSGSSFRSLGFQYSTSGSTAYREQVKKLEGLPHCADISRTYARRYCGILLVDGKYVKVKGYERKIPVLYGLDYTTHDIPTYILSRAENYQTCLAFFTSLRLLNYPLQGLVCDDNINIYQACQKIYPQAVIQLCHNHYKESLRQSFQVRIDPTYRPFVYEVCELFSKKFSQQDLMQRAHRITSYYGNDPRCVSVMIDLQKRYELLFGYQRLQHVPRTTNLIESYNSHLQGRLKSVKGFQSKRSADRWLNAYFIYRRVRPFTDCEGKFKRLNGYSSLEKTMDNPEKIHEVLSLFR